MPDDVKFLSEPAPVEAAVPLAAFARIVGPRVTHRQVTVRGRPVMMAAAADPGDPDEVWLKLLAVRHPNERRTPSGWRALIERYRNEPAHPAHPRYGKGDSL